MGHPTIFLFAGRLLKEINNLGKHRNLLCERKQGKQVFLFYG